MDGVNLSGKTVIVTGANTGIGKETAQELASRGAKVVMACRSMERGERARDEIVAKVGLDNVHCWQLDLSSLESVRAFAEKFNNEEPRLDILVNNAGLWVTHRSLTQDGFEIHFGTNHLGHFYLTYLLLDKLKASAPSRVVTVSSGLHKRHMLDFEDLQFEHNWSGPAAYGRSKTANILFTVHLAKLLQGTGVTAYSLHPGVVSTELGRDYGKCLSAFFKCCLCLCLKNPKQGASTTIYCCLEPSIAEHSGRYYGDNRERTAAPFACDEESAERLWNISLKLCKIEN